MSIIFFDGFETVGTETGLGNEATIRPRIALRYGAISAGGTPATTGFYLIDSPTGTGYAWNQGKNRSNWLRAYTPDEVLKTYVIGCNVHPQSTTDSVLSIIKVMGNTVGSPTAHISVNVENLTDLVVRGPLGSHIQTVSDAITAGAWHHVEVKVKCANSPNGFIEVKVNDTEVVNEVSVDTLDFYGNVVLVQFGSISLLDTAVTDTGEDYVAFDDLYVLKTEGADPTDYLGSRTAVITLPPNGDGTVEWTPSSGTVHYTLIDENGADSADYADGSTDTDEEMFDITNLPNGGDFHAVKVEVEAVDTSAGANSVDVRIDSNATISETNHNVTDTVNYDVFVHYEGSDDPDTASAWTESGINALKIGAQFNT